MEYLALSRREILYGCFEHAKAFPADPFAGEFQGVEADLGGLLVVASVENRPRPSSQGSGGEDHNSQVDGLVHMNVFEFYQLA